MRITPSCRLSPGRLMRQILHWWIGLICLLGGVAYAQPSALVNAPNSATGGDLITIPVTFGSLSNTTGLSHFSIDLNPNLQNVEAVCSASQSSPAGICTRVVINAPTGYEYASNIVVDGTVNNFQAGETVRINIQARIPTDYRATDYQNPTTVTTSANLTSSNNLTTNSVGNTTVSYIPYDITYSSVISPNLTFSFDSDEITVTHTFTNDGAGPAHGAWITGNLQTRNSINLVYSPWTLQDTSISCTATGGAECPASLVNLQSSGSWQQNHLFQERVPLFPTGGSVVVTTKFKIQKPARNLTCYGPLDIPYYQGVVAGVSLAGSDRNGNGYYPFALSDQISTTPEPLPECPTADLEVEIVENPPTDINVTDTSTYNYEVVFRNNGPTAVPASFRLAISAHFYQGLQINRGTWTCVSSNPSVSCPPITTSLNFDIDDFPSGAELRFTNTVALEQTGPLGCSEQTARERFFVDPSIYVNGVLAVDSDNSNNERSAFTDVIAPRSLPDTGLRGGNHFHDK